MAKDKLVDSARLDGALRATADKIRSKTGGNAPILFDMDTGYASAVDAIQAGGGGGDDLTTAILDRTITDITDNKTKEVGIFAFAACYSLRNATFNVCRTFGLNAFSSCKSLTQISFPECVEIAQGAFSACSSLSSVNFPKCLRVYGSAFLKCSSLAIAIFPECTDIRGNAFGSCSSLSALVLAGSSLCNLSGSNALSRTRIASGAGYIFVPSSLVARYQAATNWTFFSNQISAIEDSEFA